MADTAGIPRSRGGLSGVLLILLGGWGALAPFVGPYFHFAYTPDRAWAYTTGRLWLEVAPGAAAALGGLIVLLARSRTAGGLGAFLAALGGAWFIAGTAITAQFVKNGSINPGQPVGATSLHVFLVGMAFFIATGILILFFAALALGRFAVSGGASGPDWDSGSGPDSFPAGQDQYQTQEQYPAGQEQYPTTPGGYSQTGSQPATSADQATTSAPQDLFGRTQTQQQFSSPAGQFPPPSTGPFTASPNPFPPSGSGEPGSTES
jgi:hypothetical protein